MKTLIRCLKWTLILGVFVLVGIYILGMTAGNMICETTVKINNDIETAWATFQNPGEMENWMEGFDEIEMISGWPGAAGSEYLVSFEDGTGIPQTRQKILRNIPLKEMAYEFQNDAMTGSSVIEIKKLGDGQCELTNKTNFTGKNHFYNGLLKLRHNSIVSSDYDNYQRFKKLVESRP